MAYGLEPVRAGNGGHIRNNVFNNYTFASAYGTALFEGDLVKMVADGTIARSAATDVNNVGVFMGCEYADVDGDVQFRRNWVAGTVTKGSTDVKVYVYDDPMTIFKIEADQVGTALAKTAQGACADIVVAAGSTTSYKSGSYIDSSGTVGSTAAQLKILGSARTDRDFTAAGTAMDLFVLINEHLWKQTAGI